MVVGMTMIHMGFKIDEERIVQALQEAGEKLDSAEGEVVVDFSSVRRIDVNTLQALEKFADITDDKGVKAVLRGVNVGVYKVLKLMKLGSRFSFVA
jgi:anti-anti-sigma regulatory factor